MPAPTNDDDVIDSRDVIARIEELEGERDALTETIDEAAASAGHGLTDAENATLHGVWAVALDALQSWSTSHAEELTALRALASEGEDYAADWQHGATLVRESYWPTYAQELVEDVGDLPKSLPHYLVIDWEATADNLKVDYTEVDFDGVTYFVR